MNNLPWQEESVIKQSQLILNSFEYWFKHSLFEEKGLPNIKSSPESMAKQLFKAPFYLVSIGRENIPIFNYGNQKALELWELTWDEFTRFPSPKSSETKYQEERNRILAESTDKGYKTGFSGIRITSTGKRYKKENVTLWNLINDKQEYFGKAAIWNQVTFI